MLRLLPGLELRAGTHVDSNSYLVNNDWLSLSFQSCTSWRNTLRCPFISTRGGAESHPAYWPKMSLLSFLYSVVSSVTRGASTSRMNACFDPPGGDSFRWTFAA